MKLGPNQRTPKEIKDQLLSARRAYNDLKQEKFEQSVNFLEAKTDLWPTALMLAVNLSAWLAAIFVPVGFEKIYNTVSYYPLIAFFAFSYFFFYLGSKWVFKPTQEESEDDTSIFAIFSACERKARRSLISVGLSILHTIVITLFLINKDTGFLTVFN